jgi:hypothetical protein
MPSQRLHRIGELLVRRGKLVMKRAFTVIGAIIGFVWAFVVLVSVRAHGPPSPPGLKDVMFLFIFALSGAVAGLSVALVLTLVRRLASFALHARQRHESP